MPLFTPEYLTQVGTRIFTAAGTPTDEAQIVAELLVEANLCGHDSHGIIRIPQYLDTIDRGDIVPGSALEVVRDTPVLAVLEANWGFGHVAMSRAVDMGLAKARACGLAAIAVHHANHIGRLGSYVDKIARQAMVGLLFVNGTPVYRMAPWGGTEARLGTNPLAQGFPTAGGESIVLDMTTTVVAEGKVRVQRNRGEPTPDGWLSDAAGKPTNDPNVLYTEPTGTILPLGGAAGHKGYGLNVAIELLAGAVGGAGCLGKERQFRNGVLLMVLDVGQMVDLDAYYKEVDDFVAFLKTSPPLVEGGEILLPGEIEQRMRHRREAEGIFVEDETWSQITARAEQLGAELPA
jgi:uncharacterized oxidoreductase